jgi:ComF family protein
MSGQYIETVINHRPAAPPDPAKPVEPAGGAFGLPGQCEVCRSWAWARICTDCGERFAPAVPRCQRCALRLAAAVPLCGGCLLEPPPFEHTVCAADYGFPWDRLIAGFKFNGRAELAATLARHITAAIVESALARPDLVLPVPLSPARLAERGYNQAWELARRIARHLALPARADVLLRPVDTLHQADLTRARRLLNLRAAFMVETRARAVLAGRRVALVDDVLTTGATAREAALTLLRAGAGAVDIWVQARTPDA